MINEQELAEAVDRLREGEQVLGVSCYDVYRNMATDESLTLGLFEAVHQGDTVFNFDSFFVEVGVDMLKEALRAKKEVNAGC